MLTEYEDFKSFWIKAANADYLAIDTEASGEDVRDGRGYLMGISAAFDNRAEYFPFRHKTGDNLPIEWLDVIQFTLTHSPCLIFHNAKFDIPSLATIGLQVSGKFYDTMLMAHMINENFQSKALDYLGHKLLGMGKKRDDLFKAVVKAAGWEGVPVIIMEEYAAHDALLTLRLFLKLLKEFKPYEELWEWEQRFVRLLVAMESNGVFIDTELCEQQAIKGRARMEEIELLLKFNPGSPKQLGEYLLERLNFPVVALTPAGKASFDKSAMAAYDLMLTDLGSDDARLITEYRGWQKACAVAYEGYPKLLSPDGRLRPNYKMHGTVTGRLSCEQPNLQQIPRVSTKQWDGALKSCFIPKCGYELWEADYSQLELRLGASYARESGLIYEFSKADSDVFTRMANELGFTRDTTKTLTYTLQYGGGINRLCNVFKVDPERAAEIRSNYFDTYPGFRNITQKAAQKAATRGYVKMWSGRRRHFEHPETESFKAFNSVIQGGAAEIVKRTMLRLHDAGLTEFMLLQVHDSVVFELPAERVAELKPVIKEIMEAVTPDFGVRFAVDIHQWGH